MATQTPSARPTVAFLGPPSSYTHQATKAAFSEEHHTYRPVTTIKDVFDAVQTGTADLGVVPFENSTHGVVTFTLDNLADRQAQYADLAVCGEVYLDVHHFLLGHHQQDGSSPQIRRVLSHPQAFGQTQAYFAAHLRGVECVEVSSTSRAAELARDDASGATAAVASELAAREFGLDVLARCIEDRKDNTTRFFVLRRRGGERRSHFSCGGGQEGGGGGYKSLVSFTVSHRSPGALARVLDVFRTFGLNLTSINSLPSLIQPFQYLFFVEFEGSRLDDPEGRVEGALGEIEKVAESWRWLGSWQRAR